ncbi:O-antigen ligase family protein [Cesiribacter andamanensis]|uniref:Lipid A core-O-antigen ligase n=1 Tax=Cesiribacter andamanensis AMV16 TaxID=1279009 RepID=M7NQE8_9BACT|nr:O-antigen ligase family protein [Cesiribacter andamanensis]EMR03950.1 Lipid A core - O-antigen ligase [Cesiribacter andamanensis AMV16]
MEYFFDTFFLLFLTSLSIARNHHTHYSTVAIFNDIFSLVLFCLFLYISYSYVFLKCENFEKAGKLVLRNTIVALSLFSTFFFIFYFLSEPTNSEGVLLGMIGISFKKRAIPFVDIHPNLIGILTGGTFVLQILYLYFIENTKFVKYCISLMSVICFIFILFTDSRGTFFNSILTVTIIILLHKMAFLGSLRIIPFVFPVLSFLFLALLPLLAQSDIGDALSRDKKDLATGNSRAIVWRHCIEELSNFKPNHFFGYGENGHYAAGVSKKYWRLFGLDPMKKFTVTHNNFLQILFDMGYLGALCLILLLTIVLKQLYYIYSQHFRFAVVPMGYVLYYVLSGTTESIYGTYNRVYLFIFLGVLILSTILYNEYLKHAETEQLLGKFEKVSCDKKEMIV